jgi:hypothetical protein
MYSKLIKITLLSTFLFASESGAYDHGSSAGKGNWDISLTWNPFNYFEQGQSYVVLGYGLTKRLDIHGYYSLMSNASNNYYGGLSYQFMNGSFLDLSTAVGLRAYSDNSTLHLFFPQLLYTVKLSNRIHVGGSFVNIRVVSLFNKSTSGKETYTESKQGNIEVTKDVFLMVNIYENKKYKIGITAGVFNPVLWEPKGKDWYPTYSLDIKIK